MTKNGTERQRSRVIAVMLSILLCGLGQIYLRRVLKGLILFISFSCAVAIIYLAVSRMEFKIMDWGEKELMFNPSRVMSYQERDFYVADIMKITGAVQLVFTWVFSIADAWRARRIPSR